MASGDPVILRESSFLNGIREEVVEQGQGYLDFALQEKLHLSYMAPGKRVIDQKMFF